jgi:hypothetical protein
MLAAYSYSQTTANLDFRNPVLESGVAGTDGAQYRFSNVTTNVDALVTIMGRSDALVNILNPDMNTSGFDRAFQPQVGYNNGTTPGAADWWMEFKISFVDNGTTNPVAIPEFNVSGVDIDGNSQYINEYLAFFDMQDYSIEAGTGLSVANLYENVNGSMLSGKRFDGPVSNYTNIDTSATLVMVTNHYVNKNSITVRTGGRSTNVSGAADRMYSFYFQNFAYNAPLNALLASKPKKKNSRVDQDQLNVSVYPNPSAGRVNIKKPDAWTDKSVSILVYDVKGNLVDRFIDHKNDHIDLSRLKTGIYMLKIASGNENSVQRVVKM